MNVIIAAWQQTTSEWWKTQRKRFDLYASEVVIGEASEGDPIAATQRLDVINELTILPINTQVRALSLSLTKDGGVPAKALNDALHIAIAAVHETDYLLTWNFRHIDNAETKPRIRIICEKLGFRCPEICTPQELMGVSNNG